MKQYFQFVLFVFSIKLYSLLCIQVEIVNLFLRFYSSGLNLLFICVWNRVRMGKNDIICLGK